MITVSIKKRAYSSAEGREKTPMRAASVMRLPPSKEIIRPRRTPVVREVEEVEEEVEEGVEVEEEDPTREDEEEAERRFNAA